MQHQIYKKPLYQPAIIGFGFNIVAILVAISAPLGSRIGWWDYNFAVIILKWAAYTGIFGSVLCLLGLITARPGNRRRGFVYSLLGLIISVPMLFFLQSWKEAKQTSAPISDISTNTENPPSYWSAPNARTYGGFETETLQDEFYPDIKPLTLPVPADKAFDLVIEVIHHKGWKLWEPDRDALHIEATASTFWFGFKDDVVIHITAMDKTHSRIDMRSTSRATGGDGGTNANRIHSFFKALIRHIQ